MSNPIQTSANPDLAKDIVDRLANIEASLKKVEKLDSIEKNIDLISKKIENIDIRVKTTEEKFEKNGNEIGREQGHRPRAIVAKFTSFKQRETVRKSGPKQKGKRYGINEQFPKDVMDRRCSLLPIFRDAKRQGKEAKLVVDKLYVSGRRVYPRINRERNMSQSIGMDLDTNDTAGAGANRD
ncbi:hypothetical protein FSP39_021057 [Pinctada imbricata]|uniref:Uncharacterized protein n=1 Tax=Pinctada imbricata TaxID=66713 RepID=A0AA88Y1S5_PINIB|nr:hypothetical protein FSP39_021057 [Pinctada imbricata]